MCISGSVNTSDIPETWSDQAIRQTIRDEYLRDSTVTILLAGVETRGRKHVDWEIYSSMFDGTKNKKSGILVVSLPTTGCVDFYAAHGEGEKQFVYPEQYSWETIGARAEFERRYPYMLERIIDNLLAPHADISVVPWERLTVERLKYLIDVTFYSRANCVYDIKRTMKGRNSQRFNRGLLTGWQ